MTIDKFGRHIHKHIVRRHLVEEDVVADFLKHPKFKKELGKHISQVPHPTAPPKSQPTKYVIQLQSNGHVGLLGYYYLTPGNTKNTWIYLNKLYSGKIVKIRYSNDSLVRLSVDKHFVALDFHPAIPINIDSALRLRYIGLDSVPGETEPVFVEVVVEGDVIS